MPRTGCLAPSASASEEKARERVNRISWVQIAVFAAIVVVVFLAGITLLPWLLGWPDGWGWMGPGMMGGQTQGGWCPFCGGTGRYPGWGLGGLFGWFFMLGMIFVPLALVALLILGIVWLVRVVGTSPRQSDPSAPSCPHCGRAVEVDWRACPFCKEDLERLR
jgi:uncharacterized membrane protein